MLRVAARRISSLVRPCYIVLKVSAFKVKFIGLARQSVLDLAISGLVYVVISSLVNITLAQLIDGSLTSKLCA